METRRFYLATLGCKVNQYESHSLREAWRGQGMVETRNPEDAHCILVNSCAVTAKAVADVRHTIRRLHRLAPDAPIYVTGCAAEVEGKALAALEGVAKVIPQTQKSELLHRLPVAEQGAGGAVSLTPSGAESSSAARAAEGGTATLPAGRTADGNITPFPTRRTATDAPVLPPANLAADLSAYPEFQVRGYDRSRAVVKVQDGCSHRCTYCIVPLTRGRSLSRPVPEVLAEMRRLLEAGFREIGISGVNLRQFSGGGDAPFDFWDLLAAVEKEFAPEWAGRARLRISSLEPGQLGAKALEALGTSRLVAPHLHLSLQSGSPSVLRRMGRAHYDPAPVADFVRELGRAWPLFGLGADILTGFPGESDAEHRETLELCEALPLTYAHVFPYSKRPGTPAALMAAQVAADVKKFRAAALRGLVADKKQAFLRLLLQVPLHHVVAESGSGQMEEGAPQGGVRAEASSGTSPVFSPAASAGAASGVSPAQPSAALKQKGGSAFSKDSGRPSGVSGVNAQYADCRFVEGARLPGGNGLLAARPVAVAGEELLVAII